MIVPPSQSPFWTVLSISCKVIEWSIVQSEKNDSANTMCNVDWKWASCNGLAAPRAHCVMSLKSSDTACFLPGFPLRFFLPLWKRWRKRRLDMRLYIRRCCCFEPFSTNADYWSAGLGAKVPDSLVYTKVWLHCHTTLGISRFYATLVVGLGAKVTRYSLSTILANMFVGNTVHYLVWVTLWALMTQWFWGS